MTHSPRICLVGAGYVGMRLAAYLKEQGAHLCITTTTPSRVAQLQHYADSVLVLGEQGLLQWQAEIAKCQAVVVTVAPKERNPAAYSSCYVETLKQLVEVASSLDSPPHILYTSSTSVYGERLGAHVSEDDAMTPPDSALDPYAAILAEAEALLMHAMQEKKVPVTILRLGEIIGPERSPLERLKAMQGRPFSGSSSRFVNVSHLNAIIHALVFCQKKHCLGVYNLCSAHHPTRHALYERLSRENGLPEPIWLPDEVQHHPGNKLVLSDKIAEKGFCYPEEPLQ